MTHTLRVGLVQLTSHLALVQEDVDLLAEPFLAEKRDQSLGVLYRSSVDVKATQRALKARYLDWQKARLKAIFDWLAKQSDLPSLIAFPECSIPYECLGMVREFAVTAKVTVLAGTHTPRHTKPVEAYRSLGINQSQIEGELPAGKPPTSAVAIIFMPDASYLWAKQAPAVFEQSDFGYSASGPVNVRWFGAPAGQNVGLLVCSEALQLTQYSKIPDIVFILAFERTPERFQSRIKAWNENQVPVVLVNDGRFGGSGLFQVTDDRQPSWWFEAPNNGRMGRGDTYVEFELDLRSAAPQVGVANPARHPRLVRLAPLMPSNDPLTSLDESLRVAADDAATARVTELIRQLRSAGAENPTLQARWLYVEQALTNHTLTSHILSSIGGAIEVPAPSLDQLERELAGVALKNLVEWKEDNIEGIDAAQGAAISNVELSLKRRIKASKAKDRFEAQVVVAKTMPVGRDVTVQEVGAYLLDAGANVFVVSGLPGVGKTTVIETALAQSGLPAIRLKCHAGISAAYLSDYLLRAAGRPFKPTSGELTEDEAVLVLSTARALWIEDAEHLLNFGDWRSPEIAKLITTLRDAQARTGTRLIIETCRGLPLEGSGVVRRRIRGLSGKEALLLLRQVLERLGISSQHMPPEVAEAIVKGADGHPTLILVAAEACAKTSPLEVSQALKRRGGFYLVAARALLSAIPLSEDAHRCLSLLIYCREPIAPFVLESAVPPRTRHAALGELSDVHLTVENGGLVRVVPLFSEAIDLAKAASENETKQFNEAAAAYFEKKVTTAGPLDALRFALQANYHSVLAGRKATVPIGRIVDGALVAADEMYEREDYRGVVRVLSAIEARTLPEDSLAQYLEALCQTGDHHTFFEVMVVEEGRMRRRHVSLYVVAARTALGQGKRDIVREALAKAETAEPGHYKVLELQGDLHWREGKPWAAIDSFREAATKTARDLWPFFKLARACNRVGEPVHAMQAIDDARDIAEQQERWLGRRLEHGLMQEEMVALVLAGDYDGAAAILQGLENSERLAPEALVTAAYVRAYLAGPDKRLAVFEGALKKLDKQAASKYFVRARIELMRGKLLREIGSLRDAEKALEEAIRIDAENVYVKVLLIEVLREIAARAMTSNTAGAGSAVARGNELCRQVLSRDPTNQVAGAAQIDFHRLRDELS